jgi:hypothetical protein
MVKMCLLYARELIWTIVWLSLSYIIFEILGLHFCNLFFYFLIFLKYKEAVICFLMFIYGKEALSVRNCQIWFTKFRSGDRSFSYRRRSSPRLDYTEWLNEKLQCLNRCRSDNFHPIKLKF